MKEFNSYTLKTIKFPNTERHSFLDYIHSINKGPEEALAYFKLFWPDLIEVDGYVFLLDNYNQEYFDKTLSEYGHNKVEKTINTTYLYYLVGGEADYEYEVWEVLGEMLCETWQRRASSLFPEKNIIVEFTWYSDYDDPGLTLYQSDTA